MLLLLGVVDCVFISHLGILNHKPRYFVDQNVFRSYMLFCLVRQLCAFVE